MNKNKGSRAMMRGKLPLSEFILEKIKVEQLLLLKIIWKGK